MFSRSFEKQLGPALCDFMDTATVMGTECIVEVHTPAVRSLCRNNIGCNCSLGDTKEVHRGQY